MVKENLAVINVLKTFNFRTSFESGYRAAVKHCLSDVIEHLENTVDIDQLDYFREQLKKVEDMK